MRKIAIIPTLFTLGNAVCGLAAIACAGKIGKVDATVESDIYFLSLSGWLIIGGMVFDALDGYVARLSKTASEFGGQLDSLCDAITFGAAPAYLLLQLGPGWEQPLLHQMLAGIATLYMVCAIVRLARFNCENSPDPASHKRFRGLPSPAAAGCLASLAILRGALAHKWASFGFYTPEVRGVFEAWALLGALTVALLMVSRISYPHLTKQFLSGRKRVNQIVPFVLVIIIAALIHEVALAVLFWSYALIILGRAILVRSLRSERMPTPATGIDDMIRH